MTNVMMSVLVLFSSADGKLLDRAARESAGYLERLYQAPVRCVADGRPDDAKLCIALGQACESLASNLPPLAPDELQVLVRQVPGRQEVLLRGGSPFATRAAVMRFLEQCGVLFGPLQDFVPDRKAVPQFEPMDIRERPRRRLFGPHYWLNFPMDPSSFTREEWQRLVLGWSRMRATVMGYHFYQNFPWYDVEMRGFKDQSGYFFYSQRHPLAPEQELRYAVHNRHTFVSPDVEAFAEDIPEMHRWAQDTLRQAMALAHELGLKNSVTFEPFGYGVPGPYLAKMKEWNGGKSVDPKDRLHPLMREYVLSAIRSILQTYPDLDILKLVSGEGAQYAGTPTELREHILKLVGGELADSQGRPVQLPEGEALSILADTLTSCKLASEAVAEARRAGALRDGLELAIGSYPGSDLKVHPALFALIGRVVTDPAIRLHFLPAHGMRLSATAMALAPAGTFSGRKLEISGWTEFDGNMYLPQSCLHAIDRMNRTLEPLPAEALYAIQWRVASTTFNNAFFARSQWDSGLTPAKFWSSLTPLFGTAGATLMRQGMEKLEAVKPVENNFGFCYYGCWTPLLAAERADKQPPSFGRQESIDERTALLKDAHQLVDQAAKASASTDGRRLAEYFANKIGCGEIHMGYWKEVAQAAVDAAAASDISQARAAVAPHARLMLDYARQYLRGYQQYMLDRTDEGMLASYWLVAGQYAYRYAFPEQYPQTSIFYDGPPKAIPVIFDTDIGNDIDDTWALGFLLKCPELDLKLAVGDRGRAPYRAKLLAKFLERVGRTDVPVGVGLDIKPKGEGRQAEWAKDYNLKSYPGKVIEDGVQAIIDTIMKSDRPVTLICVGPVPNIAEALKREPRIAQRARFVGMHGSIRKGYDDQDKPAAEANVKCDPKACQAAFAAPWDVTITPLDTCGLVTLSGDRYQRVRDSADPIASNIIANYRIWGAAGSAAGPAMADTRSSVLFDTVAVYLAFRQDYCVMEKLGVRVTDNGFTQEDPAARKLDVATSWKDLNAFEELLVRRLTGGR